MVVVPTRCTTRVKTCELRLSCFLPDTGKYFTKNMAGSENVGRETVKMIFDNLVVDHS